VVVLQYADLMKKKRTVESDKAKIVAVIKELDRKKKEALRKAWEQVNKDFGSIFSTLLPGTEACLHPPKGMDVLDGLEVRNECSEIFMLSRLLTLSVTEGVAVLFTLEVMNLYG